VNVAVHAPGAIPLVAARRVGVAGETVEISISDDGPGLLEGEFPLACRSGWRSERSCDRPGSGLGLAQVHDLMAAEGGEVLLEPTQSTALDSVQGLTVRLRLPVFQPI
jgi:signal transduction histidine kinase